MNRRAPRSPTPRPGQGNRVGGVGSPNGLYHAEKKGNRLPRPASPKGRDLRSPWGQTGEEGKVGREPWAGASAGAEGWMAKTPGRGGACLAALPSACPLCRCGAKGVESLESK